MAAVADRPAPRRRLTKSARRAQLLQTAERVFGELGYQAATMEEIAARSGVARSLLYEHFASIDEVYLACVRTARAELDQRILAASQLDAAGAHARLRAGIVAYFTFVKDHGASWDVLFGGGPSPAGNVGRVTGELRFQTAEMIAALFIAEAPQIDPDEARAYAHAVSGAGEQLARWWRRNPEVEVEVVADRLMTVAWEGLRAVVEPGGRLGAANRGASS